jgi:hypothetical protein
LVAFLVFGLAVGYALIYSGLTEMTFPEGDPHVVSTVTALFGPDRIPYKKVGAAVGAQVGSSVAALQPRPAPPVTSTGKSLG